MIHDDIGEPTLPLICASAVWVCCVGVRAFRFLEDGDRASLLPLDNQRRLLQRLIALRLLKPEYSGMDFPRCPYSPLRPQTTIAIDQVNTTNSDTQPSVKIAIVSLWNLLQNVSNIYHTGDWVLGIGYWAILKKSGS